MVHLTKATNVDETGMWPDVPGVSLISPQFFALSFVSSKWLDESTCVTADGRNIYLKKAWKSVVLANGIITQNARVILPSFVRT